MPWHLRASQRHVYRVMHGASDLLLHQSQSHNSKEADIRLNTPSGTGVLISACGVCVLRVCKEGVLGWV